MRSAQAASAVSWSVSEIKGCNPSVRVIWDASRSHACRGHSGGVHQTFEKSILGCPFPSRFSSSLWTAQFSNGRRLTIWWRNVNGSRECKVWPWRQTPVRNRGFNRLRPPKGCRVVLFTRPVCMAAVSAG